MNKQACSAVDRLTKKTFLELLGNRPFSKPPGYSSKESYYYKGALYSKPASEQYSTNKTRAFFEKLDYNSWSILSFDHYTRTVCVEIKNNFGIKHLSIVVPEIISKG